VRLFFLPDAELPVRGFVQPPSRRNLRHAEDDADQWAVSSPGLYQGAGEPAMQAADA
jgi:hypothetical protein